LLSLPVQVIAWRTVSEMTYNVSSGSLILTHSRTRPVPLLMRHSVVPSVSAIISYSTVVVLLLCSI